MALLIIGILIAAGIGLAFGLYKHFNNSSYGKISERSAYDQFLNTSEDKSVKPNVRSSHELSQSAEITKPKQDSDSINSGRNEHQTKHVSFNPKVECNDGEEKTLKGPGPM